MEYLLHLAAPSTFSSASLGRRARLVVQGVIFNFFLAVLKSKEEKQENCASMAIEARKDFQGHW